MKITIPANGNTILETARETGIPIEAACGGRVKCGKCKIKLLQGQCSLPHAD
ncbi:MAG: 2Fe-2S iron-sulfur cluster binding domain-containing protein, partial [Clostridia bacterium]|nr:2Fe-2S iron-sulfur cluster binding domain-containing protein [Clostridia bacterium]